MQIFGKSDIGMVRDNNEDSFRYGTLTDGTIWAVVCDGMGGTEGGEIASSIAAERISSTIQNGNSLLLDDLAVMTLLSDAIKEANAEIIAKIQAEPSLEGMGTTVVAVFVIDNKAIIAHVGDSRAYIFSKSDTRLQTVDHSLVQVMLDLGQITAEEAQNSPLKNIITKCLGDPEGSTEDLVEFNIVELQKNDSILLCSDGLSNLVEEKTMRNAIYEYDELSVTVDTLIKKANSAGGSDNITIVLIK